MASFGRVQKMVYEVPKCLATRNVNYLTSRTYKLPSRYELLKQVASDRYHLNWFNDAWGKTKKTIIENWDSAKAASSTKNKKSVDDASTSATSNVGELSRSLKTRTKQNKSAFLDDGRKGGTSAVDELSKAKNKAQRQLAEDWDWDAIKQANSKKNKKIVDDIKDSATSTVEEVSKSVKGRAANAIDEATESIKAKIKEKGEILKQKISK